jgi:transcriptional antiterminator NusG
METHVIPVGWAEERREIREPSALSGSFAQWFAVYTSSRHEKRVALHFAQREIEAFLPLYAVRHRWKNRCEVTVELPLFPNYVFVRTATRERVRILEVPGVLALVGVGKVPAPLPDFEIETLRSGVGRQRLEPHAYLVIGERVRIKAGPMTGMEGVLVRQKSNFRVVLALDAIMRSVAVEVDAQDLEAVQTGPGRAVSADFSYHIARLSKSSMLR